MFMLYMKSVLLTTNDYKDILNHYNIEYDSLSAPDIKKKVENVIATKLCQCIKKVKKTNKYKTEQPAIAICNTSILKNRGLQYSGFSCYKNPSLTPFDIKLVKQGSRKLELDKSQKKGRKTRRKGKSSKRRKTRRKNDTN